MQQLKKKHNRILLFRKTRWKNLLGLYDVENVATYNAFEKDIAVVHFFFQVTNNLWWSAGLNKVYIIVINLR